MLKSITMRREERDRSLESQTHSQSLVKKPNWVGIVPRKLLLSSCRCDICRNLPNSVGTVPPNILLDMTSKPTK